MRRSRANRIITTTVVVLLNVLGGPMAWAQWLAAGPAEPATLAAEMPPVSCHGHAQPVPQDSEPMPCCDGGTCTCAVPAVFVYPAATAARIPHPVFMAPFDTSALPAHPFDDTLRPPIR